MDPMIVTEVEHSQNPMVNNNKLSSIPLAFTKVCSGLGPMNIEVHDLVKEDIGLKEPIIVRDYPSSTNDQVRYEGAQLHPSTATKV